MSSLVELSGQLDRYDGNRSDWVTPQDIPDANPLPNVKGWNILIRPIEPGSKVKMSSGVEFIIPDSVTEDVKFLTNIGQVKAMGPQCYHDPNVKPSDGKYFPHGRYGEPWCKVGDYVTWGKHQGVKYKVKGVTYVLLQDELVLMSVDDPKDINPMFNALNI